MKNKELSKSDLALIQQGAEIATHEPTTRDIITFPSIMTQVSLPRSHYDGLEFRRINGEAWINLQAGILDEGSGPIQQPLPYGPIPRLALAWISSYAKRNNTREIYMGSSAAEFLSIIGMESDGRRYSMLRRQMHALAACRMQFGFRGRTFSGQPIEQFDAWLPKNNNKRRSLWPGVMTLSEHYYEQLMNSAVPLDNRALLALKGSALALDVYSWLAHRLHRIEGRGVLLYWKPLREQFGQEYKGRDPSKEFKRSFVRMLNKVKVVYPQANVKQVKGGLLLLTSPPPVPPKVRG